MIATFRSKDQAHIDLNTWALSFKLIMFNVVSGLNLKVLSERLPGLLMVFLKLS